MRAKIVPISNVSRLSEAGKALVTRAPGCPGMGLVYGFSGLGKSTAIAWLATRQNGVYVRALSATTPSSLLESICTELGISKRHSNVATVQDIVQALAVSNRPLFVDEADYLLKREVLVETLRDIHDLASVPVVLIGMAGIERKISIYPQLQNRIAQWVEFQPATFEDTKLLAKELAEVEVKDDLVKYLHAESAGVVRSVVVGLTRIEQVARANNLHKIGMADWTPQTQLFISQGPKARNSTGR